MVEINKGNIEKGLLLSMFWNKTQEIKYPVIPVCVQNVETKEVLSIMYMDEKAFKISRETKILTLFTTSRGRIWVKGEESGNTFEIVEFRVNCEMNSLLCLVRQKNKGICHVFNEKGEPHNTCYYRKVDE